MAYTTALSRPPASESHIENEAGTQRIQMIHFEVEAQR
jgi:hypothetical protein